MNIIFWGACTDLIYCYYPRHLLCFSSVCKGSPLGELYRCVQERIRVKVHIRTFKGLRGVCSGFVVAFDKFWNMVSSRVHRRHMLDFKLYTVRLLP